MKIVNGMTIGVILAMSLSAHARNVNYDESKIGPIKLPDPLVSISGTSITSGEDWQTLRRPEVLELFREHVYGRTPDIPGQVKFETTSTTLALDGLATRTQVRITLDSLPEWQGIDLVLYTPARATGPVPVVLGLNFYGNHAITDEPDVPLSDRWMRASETMGIVDHGATEASRGKLAHRWPLQIFMERGYAVATAYCGDIEADHAEGWRTGVRGMVAGSGQRPQDDWGCIGAWAWGLSRMLDYCQKDNRLDVTRSIVIGHSRLGKTALWAGAQDERFALVISNNSGEGGASLARRNFGETIEIITNAFPHWFAPQYKTYAGRENEMPVDQHMLIALMAPRPVYVASATEDRWADPLGEFLSAVYAADVYRLFNLKGLETTTQPAPGKSIGEQIGYHIREGKHDITTQDWMFYLDFADRHFNSR